MILSSRTVPGQVVLQRKIMIMVTGYKNAVVLRAFWHSALTNDDRAREGCLMRNLVQRCISDMRTKCNKLYWRSVCLWLHLCWRISCDNRPQAGCLWGFLSPGGNGRRVIWKKTNRYRSEILWILLWFLMHRTRLHYRIGGWIKMLVFCGYVWWKRLKWHLLEVT